MRWERHVEHMGENYLQGVDGENLKERFHLED
jgi:hypothetical protein